MKGRSGVALTQFSSLAVVALINTALRTAHIPGDLVAARNALLRSEQERMSAL
jgi:hypothetical protein